VQLKLKFEHLKKSFIALSCHYNEIIQGFIYRHFESSLSEKIHEELKKEDNLKTIKYAMEMVKDEPSSRYNNIIKSGEWL